VSFFALTEVAGPSWDASLARRDQDGWEEHAAFMDRLVADCFVVLGGPLGDGERVLLLVEADDERAVRARLAEDPWLQDGRLEIAAIEPWALWLDGRQRAGP
jgi:uncharacterized protein YciI